MRMRQQKNKRLFITRSKNVTELSGRDLKRE